MYWWVGFLDQNYMICLTLLRISDSLDLIKFPLTLNLLLNSKFLRILSVNLFKFFMVLKLGQLWPLQKTWQINLIKINLFRNVFLLTSLMNLVSNPPLRLYLLWLLMEMGDLLRMLKLLKNICIIFNKNLKSQIYSIVYFLWAIVSIKIVIWLLVN